jgi:oxygen-independent coproporphyrinogen-3 oxidase
MDLSQLVDPEGLRRYAREQSITEWLLVENNISFNDTALWYDELFQTPGDKLTFFKEIVSRMKQVVPEPIFFSDSKILHDPRQLIRVWKEADRSGMLSIYIHIPFCTERRCAYCMYYSRVVSEKSEMTRYVDELIDELSLYSPAFRGREFATLYIGGGTPSLLEPSDMERLLSAVFKYFDLSGEGERACEVSPHSVTPALLSVLGSRGINRISMGVQSLDSEILRSEERAFAGIERIEEVFGGVKKAGIMDFNVDLMIGLQGDNGSGVLRSFLELASLGIPSITVYKRRSVPGVNEAKQALISAGEEMEIVEKLNGIVLSVGYRNLVRNPNFEGQHYVNSSYLPSRYPYLTRYRSDANNSCLGIGVGSNSFVGNSFYYECRSIGSPPRTQYRLFESSDKDSMRAFIINSLFESVYVNNHIFNLKFGCCLEDIFETELSELEELGLVRMGEERLLSISSDAAEQYATFLFFYKPSFLFNELLPNSMKAAPL